MLVFSALIPGTPFLLMMVKPSSVALRSWERLNNRMLAVFFISLFAIVVTVYTVSTRLVRRIRTADLKREAALHNMEHANKLASIGRLAAGVAHEINNPMAIINEKAGLMEDLATIQDIPQREHFLQLTKSIIQSVERCSSITHRLLGFARRMDVKMEKVSVNEVIKEVLVFLEREAIHRNITLRKYFVEDLPRIESDHGQLQQVLLNILNNAFEAVGERGGEVSIVTSQPDPSTVSVTIEDNGRGMSKEVKDRIYEPFFSTKGAEGTGLGLSITYGIVHKLGGSIDLRSEEGEGTKFTLNFPLKQTARE
jgi:two-component system NtrC family sensor kinase